MPNAEEWTVDRAADLLALMPEEQLTVGEVERTLWAVQDGAIVLGDPDGRGAVAALSYGAVGFVRLLAVAPGARRQGAGRALLADATHWLTERGAQDVYVGGDAPFYLFPGIDSMWTPALSFFEAAGFRRVGIELNMRFPATAANASASPPAGVGVERIGTHDAAAAVLAFVGEHWANWVAETERAIARGRCFAASDDEGVVGFICHSVNRDGWLGPMGTDPVRQHGGVGTALVAAVAADARAEGRADVEVAWVGPVGFYAKAVGAEVSRTFVRMRSRISR